MHSPPVPRGRHAPPLEVRLERQRARLGAFLAALEAYPDEARTLLVEIIGAGPRAAERRGAILQAFADLMADRFPSPHDGYAVVGAAVELAARQLRTGVPADVRELEPVLWRLIQGLLR